MLPLAGGIRPLREVFMLVASRVLLALAWRIRTQQRRFLL